MVYSEVLNYVYAAAIIFVTIFLTAPIVYTVWFDNLRNTLPDTDYGNMMKAAGDLSFFSYRILGYAVPAIVIAWGFAVAARKGVQEQQLPDEGY